ncbi:MAG: nitrite reductase, copper-containing [Pelagibacteraceae bacterium]|jgi:nitrite reductase (NO-forming)|nr:nitrite reductase, copper-containing [Pelagibacteraceae bacterium]MBT3902670.1 nitrite reductase, copper-containing [Pelagibacteraceae bacterium]MBT4646173.1 nitrite reductase, copper-containing [Pelagibacteraceae bacterium]MBT4951463.1 nitrite reductase, copper-containing [Pelagibacteraceae bacterium]MBT5213097.1 nitrite reductase, copper-containing [Pelagibacteraceae bacterium]
MNINYKLDLENKKDEWDKFEDQEFSLDFLNISNKVAFFILVILLSIVFFVTFTAKADPADDLPVVVQKLLPPPFVPIHDQVADGEAKVVKVTMIIEEKIIEIDDDGTQFRVFAFNDSVPGPLIVVHEGDYVELTLINPEKNNFQHNIDFHASTGALGGGGLTHVLPGEEVILRWKAIKPGVFVYHCAPGGEMVPWHVVKGMNGAVMVLPRDGLKDRDGNPIRYDKAYYIGEQDFYIPRDEYGNYKIFKEPGDGYSETLEVMRTLTPSHVVFNGAVDSLTGENAMTAEVGETVLFIHAQSNRDTRPHLIGGHGDFVWPNGSFNDPPRTNLETWFVPGGAAAAAIYTFHQPGTYVYLNHNLIEAFILGAKAEVQVDGKWNDDLMKQIKEPSDIDWNTYEQHLLSLANK